jgi:hypothetical protein
VNSERLARWHRHLGPDYWCRDIEKWRLIGLNSQLLGSGRSEEKRQLDWLKTTMSEARRRRIAWFLHMPLFLEDPVEGDIGYWTVKPDARAPLLDLISMHQVALVATGHVHRLHDRHVGRTRYLWAPSSGFVCGPATQPPMPGVSRLGVVVYRFDGTEVEAEIKDVAGLTPYRIDDVIHEVYPPHDAL